MGEKTAIEQAIENIRAGEALLAEAKALLDDPDAYCIQRGVDPELMRAARKVPVTAAMQAETERQLREFNEDVQRRLNSLTELGDPDGPAVRKPSKRVRNMV